MRSLVLTGESLALPNHRGQMLHSGKRTAIHPATSSPRKRLARPSGSSNWLVHGCLATITHDSGPRPGPNTTGMTNN